MTTKQILLAARAKLAKRGGWCKGTSGADKAGASVGARSPRAVSFCARGALSSVSSSDNNFAVIRLTSNITYPGSLIAFNDDPKTRKRDILALYDRAIKACK